MSTQILTIPTQFPGLELVKFVAYNRTGATLSAGHVAAIDLTGSATEAETYSAFDTNTDKTAVHPFYNLITVGTTEDNGWPIVVALEDIADNGSGLVAIQGVVNVAVAASLTNGAALSASSATATSLVAEADDRARVGILLATNGVAIANQPVLFNGLATTFGPGRDIVA